MQPHSHSVSRVPQTMVDNQTQPRIFDASIFAREGEDASLCFGPLHYEPNYRYPLLIWIHGLGENEQTLLSIMPEISLQNYVAIAPRGLRVDGGALRGWCDGSVPMWTSRLDSAKSLAKPCVTQSGASKTRGTSSPVSSRRILCSPFHEAERRIFNAIEEAKRKYHIAQDRVFIGGFDCGGTFAMRMAMCHPELFAGVLSINGPMPQGDLPLQNWCHARQLNVFLGVGANTSQYPAPHVCDDLKLLHTAGFDVTLRHYPWGNELRPTMLHDVNQWIMEQIRQTQP